MERLVVYLLLCLSAFAAEAQSNFQKCKFDPLRADFQDARVFDEMAAIFQTWVINPNTGGEVLISQPGGVTYPISLKGLTNRKFLHYESQKYGINLGWTNDASAGTEIASRNWIIVRSSPATGVLRYGDRVAIGWQRSEPYLTYQERKSGVNLVWSRTPRFEWQVLGGPRGAAVVGRSNRAILYNERHRQPLLFVARSRGGHIGWPDSDPWSLFPKGQIGPAPGHECDFVHGVIAIRYIAGDRDPAAP